MKLNDEDLDVFFDEEEFAEKVLIGEPGSEREIVAIYDKATVLIDDNMAPINTLQPMITCKTEDVADVEENTRIVINGIEFYAMEPESDGTGISTIRLFKA